MAIQIAVESLLLRHLISYVHSLFSSLLPGDYLGVNQTAEGSVEFDFNDHGLFGADDVQRDDLGHLDGRQLGH